MQGPAASQSVCCTIMASKMKRAASLWKTTATASPLQACYICWELATPPPSLALAAAATAAAAAVAAASLARRGRLWHLSVSWLASMSYPERPPHLRQPKQCLDLRGRSTGVGCAALTACSTPQEAQEHGSWWWGILQGLTMSPQQHPAADNAGSFWLAVACSVFKPDAIVCFCPCWL